MLSKKQHTVRCMVEGLAKILSQQIYIYFLASVHQGLKEREIILLNCLSLCLKMFPRKCVVVLAVELLIIFLVCIVTASEQGQLDNTAK